MPAPHIAELAWYVTGRFYRSTSGSLADYGYFLHLSGIEGKVFDGAPGEDRAHFTFAAQPFEAPTVRNGALSLALDPVGDFSVYLQRRPQGNFEDPASFSAGERIAHFRRTSCVIGTTVNNADGSAGLPIFGNNVFSARLLQSMPFEFEGRRYDLRDLLGVGVTQFGTASGTAIATAPAGYDAVVPFSGSAIRMG